MEHFGCLSADMGEGYLRRLIWSILGAWPQIWAKVATGGSKALNVRSKEHLSHTVWLNAGLIPYCLLKQTSATVKHDVFATHLTVPP